MKSQFCSVSPKWVPFKKRLAKKGLTLVELRAIEDEVLLLLTEDGEEGQEEILSFIDAKREVLIHQEVSDGISCDVLKMMEIRGTLPPEDWEDRILLMKQGTKSAKELRVIEGLEFGFYEPLAHEFNPQAIESTFASRLGKIAKEVRRTHSLEFYETNLTAVQKKQIEQFANGAVDPEHIPHAVDLYIRDLRKQIKAAEAFYFGRAKEGLSKLNKLSPEVQTRVDSLMEEAAGQCEKTSEAIIAAILHSVEEQMGMHSGVVA